MMTCREVATLVASGELERTSLMRRLGVKWHWLFCRHCRRFRDQIRSLDQSLRGALGDVEQEMAADLADRAAERMSEARD